MSIKTNTTDLQALLEVANNLPVAENLDTELSTQDTLIANIMTALEGKTAGGGGSTSTTALFNDVNFRDYDGTILYSYTADEALALTALPELPTQDGLTCQGWNWSLENIKNQVNKYGKCEIGATYITDDGKTRIYITLEEGRTSPMLGVCPNGTVTVDWGDGTTPDTLTGTSTSTVAWTPTHNYATAGDYIITLTVDEEMGFYGASGSTCILRYSSADDDRNHCYQNAVQKVEIGDGVTSIGDFAFYSCYTLASINIPDGVTNIGSGAFSFCYSLANITIPDSVTNIGSSAFYGCHGLTRVNIPDSVTSIGNQTFYYCYSLASVTIPDGVTSIGDFAFSYCHTLTSVTIPDGVTIINDYAFESCRSLASITIPDSVTNIAERAFQYCYSLASIIIPDDVTFINSYAFYGCYSLAKIRFNRTTPPTVLSSNAFTGIPTDCIISVPTGCLSAYISATNYPSSSTYIYIEED